MRVKERDNGSCQSYKSRDCSDKLPAHAEPFVGHNENHPELTPSQLPPPYYFRPETPVTVTSSDDQSLPLTERAIKGKDIPWACSGFVIETQSESRKPSNESIAVVSKYNGTSAASHMRTAVKVCHSLLGSWKPLLPPPLNDEYAFTERLYGEVIQYLWSGNHSFRFPWPCSYPNNIVHPCGIMLIIRPLYQH